jgi:hypothetical protein
MACNVLLVLADVEPAHRKGMAEAGVMGLLLALYAGIGDSASPGFAEKSAMLAARLARLLVESTTVAARDLERAICAQDPLQCFGALLLLQVRQPCLRPSARLINNPAASLFISLACTVSRTLEGLCSGACWTNQGLLQQWWQQSSPCMLLPLLVGMLASMTTAVARKPRYLLGIWLLLWASLALRGDHNA